MSSTTTTVSMNARNRSGKRGPTSASRPSANAVSVDIAITPAMRGGPTGIDDEIDRDCNRHPADPRQQGQREASPLPQLAQVELPPGLEPNDEEEERHQPAVHPLAKLAATPPFRRPRSRASSPTVSHRTTRRHSPRRARRPPPRAGQPRRPSPFAETRAGAFARFAPTPSARKMALMPEPR